MINDWVDPKFFFSKGFQWKETAIVGVLADFVLYSRMGDILEIGCGISSIFLSALADKYNRKIYYCDSDKFKMNNIEKEYGFSKNGTIYTCSSNEMFEKNEITPLAFAFIDGYHRDEQYEVDFWNTEKLLVPNGYILMHDSYPPQEDMSGLGACGTVYQFRQKIEKDNRFDCLTFVGNKDYVASTLIRKKPLNRPYYQE